MRVVRIAKDLMFTASEGNFFTATRVGIATTFHQAAQSNDLVDMRHHAGNIMNCRVVIKLDSVQAKKTHIRHNGRVQSCYSSKC